MWIRGLCCLYFVSFNSFFLRSKNMEQKILGYVGVCVWVCGWVFDILFSQPTERHHTVGDDFVCM